MTINSINREQVLIDLRVLLDKLLQTWEYNEEITLDTLFFEDLGFESIDVVTLGAAIEEHYGRSFPFLEFLAEISEREVMDIRVGDVVEFIFQNLNTVSQLKEGGRDI